MRVDWLDVFTDIPFAGNPLAVVPDADPLDDDQMQEIAAELGLSETVFVFGGAKRIRIFTPRAELPLAGHPVIGATHDLVRLGRIAAEGTHVFETGVGATPVETRDGLAVMTQAAFEPGSALDPAEMAALVGVAAHDVIGVPRIASTTNTPYAFVRVRDRETLAAVTPDLAAIETFERAEAVAAWCEEEPGLLAQRFFIPRYGIDEDPATGSAAGALCALRVFEGGDPDAVTVTQGAEIGRPSTIEVTVGGEPGAPADVRIGGAAVLVLEAEIRV
jgi:trans-2,3-dihydro-3-hydroxyanthranilate isomerase